VGSGSLGFALTDAHDCHVYLLDGGEDAVLIDAGCGLASARIAANVQSCIGQRRVSRIYLTHAHADHAGGAADLADHLGATVYALAPVATIVATADEDASGLRRARQAGVYPKQLRPRPAAVTPLDPAPVAVGDLTLEIHPTPGHATGHCCFSALDGGTRMLFSGDLVFSRGRVAFLATPDSDLGALDSSLRSMAKLAPDALLPGHGTPVLRDAQAHLQTAVTHLDRAELPPGLLR
jgi:glyoxylase-like metal-dependent hydrolase (beta-lactamase superfamily II)